jgi:hypothetical protein
LVCGTLSKVCPQLSAAYIYIYIYREREGAGGKEGEGFVFVEYGPETAT